MQALSIEELQQVSGGAQLLLSDDVQRAIDQALLAERLRPDLAQISDTLCRYGLDC
jgi:bacteriocin-like protein